jgi:hypothetical protein
VRRSKEVPGNLRARFMPTLPAHPDDARSRSSETVDAFLAASVGYRVGRERRVREEIERDPGLVTRHDPGTGWAALHVVCASRWHLDPARAPGLFATARLLLEHGADALERTEGPRSQIPLRCAVISAASSMNNVPIISKNDADAVRVLLDAGADPARYRNDDGEPAPVVVAALAAGCDLELIELLLTHGADPPTRSPPCLTRRPPRSSPRPRPAMRRPYG